MCEHAFGVYSKDEKWDESVFSIIWQANTYIAPYLEAGHKEGNTLIASIASTKDHGKGYYDLLYCFVFDLHEGRSVPEVEWKHTHK